jgi:hypothetical protein
MAPAGGLTHIGFASKLAIEGCLPLVEGKAPAKMPVEAAPMDIADRARAGADQDALAVFYPVGDSGVFFQMQGATARIWYNNVDCDGAVEAFERALLAGADRPAAVRVGGSDLPDHAAGAEAVRHPRARAGGARWRPLT